MKRAPQLLAQWKCCFGFMYSQADQLSTKKVLLQLGKYALNSHCSIQRRGKMNGSVAQNPKAKMRFLDKKLRAQFPFG